MIVRVQDILVQYQRNAAGNERLESTNEPSLNMFVDDGCYFEARIMRDVSMRMNGRVNATNDACRCFPVETTLDVSAGVVSTVNKFVRLTLIIGFLQIFSNILSIRLKRRFNAERKCS
jgi:hypothetical protein